MKERIKNILKGQLTTSVIYILLGLCLVFAPVSMVYIICKFVFGILLVAAGLYHVIIYVWEKTNATMMDMFSGTIILVLGIFLFSNPQIVIKLLPMLLGAFILIDCFWTLRGCLKLKKHGSNAWKILLVGMIIFLSLGIIMILNPFKIKVVKTIIIFAGTVFLANGVLDLVFMILIRRGTKEKVKTEENTEKQEEEQVEKESAAESTDSYEPWNGVTAAANKPAKKSFWKKRKKEGAGEVVSEDVENADTAEVEITETGDENSIIKN